MAGSTAPSVEFGVAFTARCTIAMLLAVAPALSGCEERCTAHDFDGPVPSLGLQGRINDGDPHPVSFDTPTIDEDDGARLTWFAEATPLDPLDVSPFTSTYTFEVRQSNVYPVPDLGALGEVQIVAALDPDVVAVHRPEEEGGGLLWLLANTSQAVRTSVGWSLSQAPADGCHWRTDGSSRTRNRAILIGAPDAAAVRVEPSLAEAAIPGLGIVHVVESIETVASSLPNPIGNLGDSTNYTVTIRAAEVPTM